MNADRREFLKQLGVFTAAGAGISSAESALASGGGHSAGPEDPYGVLVDLTICIGCRLCEHACKKSNGIDPGPLESYDDQSVFKERRRPSNNAFTVVNAYPVAQEPSKSVYVKTNCMHCNHPACASACIVGALRKKEDGAVTYDAWKCIGCRYCMVACPFQIPTYEYERPYAPEVRKCNFCHSRITEHQRPACVDACPRQAMIFGRRKNLLTLAHSRIDEHPDQYQPHVYGENEVGGTSWMYISKVPFQQAGFLPLGQAAPPALTEAIQHGVFKYWIAPVGWYSVLAGMYWWTGRKHRAGIAAEIRRSHGHAEEGQPATAELAARRSLALAAGGGVDTHIGAEHLHLPRRKAVKQEHRKEHHHGRPAPVPRKLLTPGVLVLLAMVLVGIGFWVYRMVFGLAATTNLTNERPWGLWIAMDVGSGIALAGGGFVAAAIFHVFHRERYHMLARSALVTALLGYTFYVPGLLADLGKWWKLPITMWPECWQGNSVLFEVGMCVMIYLNVQYAELTPIICERLLGEQWFARFPRVFALTRFVKGVLEKLMPALLCLGVCLSTFHQSSLGNLMNIAPYKLHHLWWGPLSPLLFLLSAAMVGLPMVIFTILFASWCLNREPEMDLLTRLARRYVPVFIGLYLAAKTGDLAWRGAYIHLWDGSRDSFLWIAEMILVIVPFVLFLIPAVTRSAKGLTTACLLVILGVVLNRLNVLVLGFHPPFETRPYVPSLTEFMVSMGLVAALLLTYRVMVTYLPILDPRPKAKAA